MNKSKNLYSVKDVCRIYGILRYDLQRYKKLGLIKETKRNKYGYLFFDEETVKKIGLIRFLQNIETSLPEIKRLINGPVDVIKKYLVNKSDELVNEIKIKKNNIKTLNKAESANSFKELIEIIDKEINKGK